MNVRRDAGYSKFNSVSPPADSCHLKLTSSRKCAAISAPNPNTRSTSFASVQRVGGSCSSELQGYCRLARENCFFIHEAQGVPERVFRVEAPFAPRKRLNL